MNRQDAKLAKAPDSPAAGRSGAAPGTDPDAMDRLLDAGRPRWDAIAFDVLCPRCDYNLRLLTSPRCPECGLEFDWRVVLDAGSWRSDFLFEHHWRTHPIRSWLKTTWQGLRPFRFFKGLSIHDDIHPGPLWFLLLTSVLGFVVTVHALAWVLIGVVKLARAGRQPAPLRFPSPGRLDLFEHLLADLASIRPEGNETP